MWLKITGALLHTLFQLVFLLHAHLLERRQRSIPIFAVLASKGAHRRVVLVDLRQLRLQHHPMGLERRNHAGQVHPGIYALRCAWGAGAVERLRSSKTHRIDAYLSPAMRARCADACRGRAGHGFTPTKLLKPQNRPERDPQKWTAHKTNSKQTSRGAEAHADAT